MKTKLELAALSHKYLCLISDGYKTGNFLPLFPYLAEDCVFESQWVMTPNNGYDEVTSYLSAKGEAIKKSGSFPSCYIQELVGNINPIKAVDINECEKTSNRTVGLYYPHGEPCLLLTQTSKDNSENIILRIRLNDNEKISRIDLCMPELFQYRDFEMYTSIYPCIGDKTDDSGKININEDYLNEFYLFFSITGKQFDMYEDFYLPMEEWIEFLNHWKRFYSFKTFDEAFEDACGIDYTNFTVKNQEAKYVLVNNGEKIWHNRKNNAVLLKGLIEWTDKYKNICDNVYIYGC